jgi:hypothetical protein
VEEGGEYIGGGDERRGRRGEEERGRAGKRRGVGEEDGG